MGTKERAELFALTIKQAASVWKTTRLLWFCCSCVCEVPSEMSHVEGTFDGDTEQNEKVSDERLLEIKTWLVRK